MPEEFLRLLLGGVGWGFGLMLARQGDNHHLCCSRQCVFHGGLWDLRKSWRSTIPARLVRFCKTWKKKRQNSDKWIP